MSLQFAWPVSRAPERIAAGEVHVWCWPLDEDDGRLAADTALLDPEEHSRLERFRFDRHRIRFAASHANLRRILGAYLRLPPESLAFRANRFGKPEVHGLGPVAPIQFNLSHSHSIALLALSLDVEVGVDVEDLRPMEPEIAGSHFSAQENSDLASLEDEAWLLGFYRCWTRKEAILKAEGVGLRIPLAAFDVSLLPDAPARLLSARAEAGFRRLWMLHNLSPAPGVAAALAVAEPNAAIRCFTLQK